MFWDGRGVILVVFDKNESGAGKKAVAIRVIEITGIDD